MLDWKEVTRTILDRLDIASEYKDLGLQIVGKMPNAGGWISVRAMGREDKSQSAAINVGTGNLRGRYVDKGGECFKGAIWDFAAKFAPHRFKTWQDARQYYAEKTGTSIPKQSKQDFSIDFLPRLGSMIRAFVSNKKGITATSIEILGGRCAHYPKGARNFNSVVAFPIYNRPPDTAQPCGWLVSNVTGGRIPIYQGPTSPPIMAKVAYVRPSKTGLVGLHGLLIKKPSLVWKVEGLSDALALQSAIPKEMIDKVAVITNAGGCGEHFDRDWSWAFQGADVIVVGDADEPGQIGAARWAEAIAPYAASVRCAALPFKVEQKHGKDIRDFLNGGGTYESLLKLAGESKVYSRLNSPPTNGKYEASRPKTPTEHVLDQLKLEVLGEYPDNEMIECFSIERRKLFTIKNINRFTYADMLRCIGEPAQIHISRSKEPVPGKLRVDDVKDTISFEAGRHRLDSKTTLGAGCWHVDGTNDIVLVDSGCAALWDGKTLRSLDRPRIGAQVLDFSSSESWCKIDALREYLSKTDGPELFGKIQDIFSLWRWRNSWCSSIITSLVFCTWVQTLWRTRPHVAITGDTSAGKSTLLRDVVQRIFSNLVVYSDDPSAAGIRQHVRNDACAIVLDELERSSHRGEVLTLLRTATGGGRVLRGTPGQKGMSFRLRHIVWIGAIEAGLKRQRERERFIQLEAGKQPQGVFGKLSLPTSIELADIGLQALAVSMRNVSPAMELAAKLKSIQVQDVGGKNIDGRTIESYSVPVSMMASIYGKGEEWARDTLTKIVATALKDEDNSTEGEALVSAILGSQFHVGGGRTMSVSEVISDPTNLAKHRGDLEKNGIALVATDRRGPRTNYFNSIFVCPDKVQRFLLRSTQWGDEGMDIRKILRRIPNAASSQKLLMKQQTQGVLIPIDKFLEIASGSESADEDDLDLGGKDG